MPVVRLIAVCDIDVAHTRDGQAAFVVSELAVLDDGREVTLHQERGFACQSSSGDPWHQLTLVALERDVRTTVLPDDESGEEHPWAWLVERADRQGIATTSGDLQRVPYEVRFTERVRQRLQTEA